MNNGTYKKQAVSEVERAFEKRGVAVLIYENRYSDNRKHALTSPLRQLLRDSTRCKGDKAKAHFEYAIECYGISAVEQEINRMKSQPV